MHEQIRRKVMAAVPVGSANAKSAADIADDAGLNRRSMGTRLNAISAAQSAGDDLLHVRTASYRGSRKNLWWREGGTR